MYIVIDASTADGSSLIHFVNHLLPILHNKIASDPLLDLRVRCRIIEVGTGAKSLLSLSQFSSIAATPLITQQSGFSLKSAFTHLKECIENDVVQLKERGSHVYRPLVAIFISHESETDDWL